MSELAQSAESVASPQEAITRAPLTAGNRAENDTPAHTPEGSLSLDKLVFTFNVPEVLWPTFRKRMQRLGDSRRGGHIYRESLIVDDPAGTTEKLLVQWSPYLLRSVPFGRVEFNPAKMRGWAQVLEAEIRPFLRRGWESANITRIDPAVDYPVALRDHVYYGRNHKGAAYYSADGIETLYLGSAQSNSRIRIYDKAKELTVQKKPVPPYPLTRIEAQRRSTGISVAHVQELRNPFRGLGIGRPSPEGASYKYQLYLREAEKHGVDPVVKRLGRHERRRFKEMLAESPPAIRHPGAVFDADYVRVCREELALFFTKGGTDGVTVEAGTAEGTESSKGDGHTVGGVPHVVRG